MVLTAITDTVRAVAAGSAQRMVKDIANDVKSIAGLNAEGSNSTLGATANLMGGQSSTLLAYPINVDSDEQQGHYIMFHTRTRSNGKLLAGDKRKDMDAAVKAIKSELNIPEGIYDGDGNFIPYTADEKRLLREQAMAGVKMAEVGPRSGRNASLLLSKLPTTKLEKSIALYMPPNVQVNYEVKYADQEIGVLAMAGAAIINELQTNNNFETKLSNVFDTVAGAGREGAIAGLSKVLDTAATGAAALIQMQSGSVITPRMEMMFEGVGRRSFSYTFSFIPKSKQEALVIEEIIKHFKFYAMPAYSNPTTRREMDIPGTFDIEYMYQGKVNSFLNKIHTCFLTKVGVQYGGDRYTAYEEIPGRGPPPQKSTLSLEFTELELLSQQHIADGY